MEEVKLPAGYEIHEIPPDYDGKVWIEGQLRQYAYALEVHHKVTDPVMKVADQYAPKLAMYLELFLLSTDTEKWRFEAMKVLGEYRTTMGYIEDNRVPNPKII